MMIFLYTIIVMTFFWYVTAPLFKDTAKAQFEDSDNASQKQRMGELLSDLELDYALNNINEDDYKKLKSTYDRT